MADAVGLVQSSAFNSDPLVSGKMYLAENRVWHLSLQSASGLVCVH